MGTDGGNIKIELKTFSLIYSEFPRPVDGWRDQIQNRSLKKVHPRNSVYHIYYIIIVNSIILGYSFHRFIYNKVYK